MYCFTSDYPNFDSWFSVSLGILGTFEVIFLFFFSSGVPSSYLLFFVVGVWCPKSSRSVMN